MLHTISKKQSSQKRSKNALQHIRHTSPHTTISRNVNMYKYKAPKHEMTNQERHARANRQRRREAEKSRFDRAIEIFEDQQKLGVKNPVLPEVSTITAAQKRRLDIRKAMQQTETSGDLSHLPLMIQFLKKMHGLEHHTSSITNQQHIQRVQQDTQILQKLKLLDDTKPPEQSVEDKLAIELAYGVGNGPYEFQTVATPLDKTVDPTVILKRSGNALSQALLSPVADTFLTPPLPHHNLKASPITQIQIDEKSPSSKTSSFYQLPPISNSISGAMVTGISLGNPEFGSGPGSPNFRLTPLDPNSTSTDGIVATNHDAISSLDRRLDAEMALAGEGLLGLHENSLQKHADEFTTQNMLPTLGFLGSFQPPRESKTTDNDSPVNGLDQETISGIGGLTKLEDHNPGGSSSSKRAIISGRRSRAIEIIAKTIAAVLTKKQLLAHNRSLLEAINPNLVQKHRESKKKHNVDLYDLGYEITRIQLSKDLNNCTVFWSAKCLFPLAETTAAIHEIERPLLDTVQVMAERSQATNRVELHPSTDAMNRLKLSNTHISRRTTYEIGDLYNRDPSEFTSVYNQAAAKAEIERNKGAEVYFDEESDVVVKKMANGELRIMSQGNPKLWKLRSIFKAGSYMPGTVDVLPPQYRRNVNYMSPEQRQQKQDEADEKHRQKIEEMRAESMIDPNTGLPAYKHPLKTPPKVIGSSPFNDKPKTSPTSLDKSQLQHIISQVSDTSLSNNVSHTGDATLETLLKKQNTQRHSTMSINTFNSSLSIVASSTNEYLNKIIPSIRWALGQSLNTKFIPQVKFEFDHAHGAAQQRASTINAVLQRQLKRQLELRGDSDSSNTNSPRSEVENKLDNIIMKNQLLDKRHLEEYEEIELDEKYHEQQLRQQQHQQFNEAENAGFDELADMEPIIDADEMTKEKQLQDNIAKLRASASSLKTGKLDPKALQTSLKYHDITIEDKRRIVKRYLDLDDHEARELSEERMDTVLNMLRREMNAHQRRKERDALEAKKRSEGASSDEIRSALLRFDNNQPQNESSDVEDGVSRWEFGLDKEESMPQYQQLLQTQNDNDDLDKNREGHYTTNYSNDEDESHDNSDESGYSDYSSYSDEHSDDSK